MSQRTRYGQTSQSVSSTYDHFAIMTMNPTTQALATASNVDVAVDGAALAMGVVMMSPQS
jgi:hypothetical protein